MIQVASVPVEFKAHPQWVAWKYGIRHGKCTKIPIDCHTGAGADSTNPATWTTFADALAYHQAHKADGIGYVFADNDPFSGIDLDKVLDPNTGEIKEFAWDIITQLNSYSEVSPSGCGIKIIVEGKLPRGSRCKNTKLGVEIYSRERYFTVTSNCLDGTPPTIEQRQDALVNVYRTVFGITDAKPAQPAYRPPTGAILICDSDLIEKATNARNGAKFFKLWGGDTTDYPSHSEADQAFCNLLSFWCAGDRERIDSLFRQSGLYRPKWDREDYRRRTIDKALANRSAFYIGSARQEQSPIYDRRRGTVRFSVRI
jgi:putative DNA primase/helicase